MSKIKTQGAQAFNVPNDSEGQEFLRLLRKFRNRGWSYHARGRGSRKEHGNQHSIAQEHSEWMAVYLDDSKKKVPGQPPAEPKAQLTPKENELLTQAVHGFIDDHNFVMTEDEYEAFEEIHAKLDLDMNDPPEPMEEEIQACGPLAPYVQMNHILLVKNGGHSFLPGDHVGINQFNLGHPIVNDGAEMVGIVVEGCGPDEDIRVRIG